MLFMIGLFTLRLKEVRFSTRRNLSHGWRCALIKCPFLDVIDLGITFAVVTGLYSAASRSALQPAGCAGWIELLRYSLMPLGDFARRRSPCSHRSSMAMPLIPPCRDHSVTKSALSGCLSASRPHTHGSFRR